MLKALRHLLLLSPSLAFLAASVLAATLGVPRHDPAPWADRLPAPKAGGEGKPKYHTTDASRFYLDGVEVTAAEFNRHDGLVIEELVIDGDVVLIIKARTKAK